MNVTLFIEFQVPYYIDRSRATLYKATPIGNYVSGPLKMSPRCGRAEFSNKATMK